MNFLQVQKKKQNKAKETMNYISNLKKNKLDLNAKNNTVTRVIKKVKKVVRYCKEGTNYLVSKISKVVGGAVEIGQDPKVTNIIKQVEAIITIVNKVRFARDVITFANELIFGISEEEKLKKENAEKLKKKDAEAEEKANLIRNISITMTAYNQLTRKEKRGHIGAELIKILKNLGISAYDLYCINWYYGNISGLSLFQLFSLIGLSKLIVIGTLSYFAYKFSTTYIYNMYNLSDCVVDAISSIKIVYKSICHTFNLLRNY